MSERRQYLIAAGCASYRYLPQEAQLPSVRDDLRLVSDFFSRAGYERVLPELGEDPTSEQLKTSLGDWLADEQRSPNDVLVFYFSGHGEGKARDTHYLLLSDSRFNSNKVLLSHTAVAADELARSFADSKIQHSLLIFDTCYSSEGSSDFAAKFARIIGGRRWYETAPQGIGLIAASRAREMAAVSALARTFVSVAQNETGQLGGRTQQFLQPAAIVTAINARLERGGVLQRATWQLASPQVSDTYELIPNPFFLPDRVVGGDLEDYWLPKARGGDVGSKVWYFTGRERALAELTAWISTLPDRRIRVVTGGPGTGKSALLGRIVALADPAQRQMIESAGGLAGLSAATVPPVGAIDVSVHSRGRKLADLLDAIAGALGIAAKDTNTLVSELSRRERPVTIVVDALDEAADAPRRIAVGLLRPLGSLDTVRLLVGTRPENPSRAERRVPSLGDAAIELDLDDPTYLGPSDIEDYVVRRLLAREEPDRHTPYRDQPLSLVREVARAVSAKVGEAFLFARIVSSNLADAAAPIDIKIDGWQKRLPANVNAAFEEFLQRFDANAGSQLSTRAVTDLLRPLAFAAGAGLPREQLWEALASEISGEEYVDDDVAAVLREAGAYVVEVQERGGSVYRLYHELLAEYLREAVGQQQADVHRLIVDALVALIPTMAAVGQRDWRQAHPYVLAHLAEHAAKARRLDEFLLDPLFLVAADPRRLVPVLPKAMLDQARRFARVYELASHQMEGRSIGFGRRAVHSLGERLSYLELAAHQHGEDDFLETSRRLDLDRPWRTAWANWWPVATHRVFDQHVPGADWLFPLIRDGEPALLVSTGMEMAAYRLDSGEYQHLFDEHKTDVTWVDRACGTLLGAAVICYVGIRASVLSTGVPVTEPVSLLRRLSDGAEVASWSPFRSLDHLTLDELRIVGFELVDLHDGLAAFIAAQSSGERSEHGERGSFIELWTLAEQPPRLLRSARTDPIASVAAAVVFGHHVFFLGGFDGALRVWDDTLKTQLVSINIEPSPISSLAVHAAPDQLMIACAQGEIIRFIRVGKDWAVSTPEPSAGHAEGVVALSMGEIDGEPVCASVGRDNMLKVWRCTSGEPLWETLIGFRGVVPSSVAFATARGEPVVVTSDSRPGVRVWSYSRRHDEPKGHQSPGFVTDLHAWRAGQTDRVLARNTSGYLGLLDGKTGELLGTPFAQSESDWADALAATCFKNRPVAAAVLGNKTLQAWYVDTGEKFGPAIELEGDNRRHPIGLCAQGEHLFAATVRQYTPRSILLHDLVTGESVESPPGSGEWRTYLLVPGSKGPLVVTFGWRSQLRIWSCQTGATLDIDVRAYSATGCLLRGRPSIVCIDLDSYLHVFDADTGERTMVPFEVTKREHLAAIDVDGELLVAMGDSIGLLEIWREKKLQMEIDVNGEITALAVLPPRTLIVGAAEGVLCIRSAAPL